MGMYDEVAVPCPRCHTTIYFQSKAGPRKLNVYSISDAPPEILADLNDSSEYCERCKKEVTFVYTQQLRPELWYRDDLPTSTSYLAADDLLRHFYAQRRTMGLALALWVVDRPDLLHWIRQFEYDHQHLLPPSRFRLAESNRTIFGMALKEWWSTSATEAEWRSSPAFCRRPGVYIEMSNGHHIQLIEP